MSQTEIEHNTSKNLVPKKLEKIDSSLESRLPDIEAIKQRYMIIQRIKSEILTDDDYVELSNGTMATAKSGWLKYGVAFALSYEILTEEKIFNPTKPDVFTYKITMRAWDPTHTRYADGTGACTINEKSTYTTEHIVRAMADTRATERCIIKMLGTNEKAADDLPENLTEEYCKCKGGTNQKDMSTMKCLSCKKSLKPTQ